MQVRFYSIEGYRVNSVETMSPVHTAVIDKCGNAGANMGSATAG